MTRPYTMRRRAATQMQTRRRILDAALRLYESHGPADTTILAIAERAGVQRLTLYRHFEDERILLDAVWALWSAAHPFPDVGRVAGTVDPRQRVRDALEAAYGFYEGAAPFLLRATADRDRMPVLAELLAPYDAWLLELRRRLAEGWGASGRGREWIVALVGHALHVESWRSLVRDGGLAAGDAARVMSRAIADLARDPYA
ncbi:MAG: TetR family transcriptional regulator [Gemmatimonadaceae bacterium]|nr:TetR family transcriptional regulator [Gemmatimonadaceae bacterium]NUQ94814.1 TetR family transcriptional regulator [Gemmatimonadaceae bacterium]NUR18385.1 TetR family transcriptional regulator [Gemmatimonadaceae bacterium]NUS96850.1 TetR family transcriptional regulator [Gemmatimonadaceae bacterium]